MSDQTQAANAVGEVLLRSDGTLDPASLAGAWREQAVEIARLRAQLAQQAQQIAALVEQFKAKAVEARKWASECADWDGANRHELRNRAGVYYNCATELLAALQIDPRHP